MKRIGWIVASAALCLLCACAPAETVWETVCDGSETEPCFGRETYAIYAALPVDAVLQPEAPEKSGRTYYREDGNCVICTRVLLASDADSAIHQLTGFHRDQLRVVETRRGEMPEYRFAWYDARDEVGALCRCDMLRDGMTFYAVTVSVREGAEYTCADLAKEVFSAFGLYTEEGF